MQKIVDYKIVYVINNSKKFEEDIKKLLKEGWLPYGAPTVSTSSVAHGYTNTRFIQHMVKYDNEEL
jgi:hypothetical protein